MKATVTTSGQIELPVELRDEDQVFAGQEFEIMRVEAGKYLLTRVQLSPGKLLQWLFSCPAKDWFAPMPSESTGTIRNHFEPLSDE